MPAGMVRPRASQVDPLGAGAVAEYREAGWRITEHGNVDTGQVVGPCAACTTPTVRYGERGRPLCNECQPRADQLAPVLLLDLARTAATTGGTTRP